MSELASNLFCNKQTEKSQRIVFSIQGNIGCGKSTFLSMLEERLPNIKLIKQPVSQWQNIGGKNLNLLEKYYKEPSRWGFTFQIYAVFTRFKHLMEACSRESGKPIVSERSIFADRYVFSELMRQLNYIDEAQHLIFLEMYKNYSQTIPTHTKIVYLRCTPQKCYQRTKSRNRQQQNQISLQYLNKIHEKHQNWIMNLDPNDVLIIDTTLDFKNNEDKITEIIQNFSHFMNKLQ